MPFKYFIQSKLPTLFQRQAVLLGPRIITGQRRVVLVQPLRSITFLRVRAELGISLAMCLFEAVFRHAKPYPSIRASRAFAADCSAMRLLPASARSASPFSRRTSTVKIGW